MPIIRDGDRKRVLKNANSVGKVDFVLFMIGCYDGNERQVKTQLPEAWRFAAFPITIKLISAFVVCVLLNMIS